PERRAIVPAPAQVARELLEHRDVAVEVLRTEPEAPLPVAFELVLAEGEGGEPDPVHREIRRRESQPALEGVWRAPEARGPVPDPDAEPAVAEPRRGNLKGQRLPVLVHGHRLAGGASGHLARDPPWRRIGSQPIGRVLEVALADHGEVGEAVEGLAGGEGCVARPALAVERAPFGGVVEDCRELA